MRTDLKDKRIEKVQENHLFPVLKEELAFREYNPHMSVDNEIIHFSKNEEDHAKCDTMVKAEQLRKEYMANYVTSMNLHTLYILDSKISKIEQR